MTRGTPIEVLVPHAVRLLGYADTACVAERLGLPEAEVHENLLDAQASGRVGWSEFDGDGGWSPTTRGARHSESLLAAELDDAGARTAVEEVHRDFLPLNDEVSAACTAWQLTELGVRAEPVTALATLAALEGPAAALVGLEERLVAHLERFAGYHGRFAEALEAARDDTAWITAADRDSCHRVWFELHEDLIATLGLSR
ncbi:transcriptional regulator [Isoptericola croceus]|uniref:transcriptional regulator n=1 Tax=Isoptericola croceus TaxID=3031406 RepID=UPI0023F95267|nr:transcriptional regulator [Isoptericola croceus]